MSVKKYRSVDQMPGPATRPPLDPENLRIAFELMNLTHRLAGIHHRPGIRKYRSWNELLRAREDEAVGLRKPTPQARQ